MDREDGVAQFGDIRRLRIDELVVSPYQARVRDVDRDLDELVENIRVHGQLEPIIVTPRGGEHGKYEIVVGQRRWLAMRRLGVETINAAVLSGDEDDATLRALSISENLIRRELSQKDMIDACTKLYRKYGSVKAVAEEFGLPYGRVRNYVKYDRLRPALKALVEAGVSDIKTAIRLEDHYGDREVGPDELRSVAAAIAQMTNAQQVDYLEMAKAGRRDPDQARPPGPGASSVNGRPKPGAVTQIIVTLRRDHADRLRQWARSKKLTQDKGAAMIIEAFLRRLTDTRQSDTRQ